MDSVQKTIEEKEAALKSIFESLQETTAQEQIQEIQKLANAETMKDFIKEGITITPAYTYSDFLDEIFRCLSKIELCQAKFIEKMKDMCLKSKRNYSSLLNTFERWIVLCFQYNWIDFMKIVALCGDLYSQNQHIPFSFISTQIIRLFHFPNDSCVEFLKDISLNSLPQQVLGRFKAPPKPEIKDEIVRLASLILSEKEAISPFNTINNSVGKQNSHSETNTVEHLQEIVKNLSFHLLPFGYVAYAHTDYKKNIYLSDIYLPKVKNEHANILMSVISLIHEVGHLKRIESAHYCCPLEFTPPSLNYEAGESIEKELFGGVINHLQIPEIDLDVIFQDPHFEKNFLTNLKKEFKKVVNLDLPGGGVQDKFLGLPKD